MQSNNTFRSGYISLVGRPNVGKSTILNFLLQKKISIVTPFAQTTRNRLEGIYNDSTHQVIFVDTPGIHRANNELGKIMNQLAFTSFSGVDAVCYIVDSTKPLTVDDETIFKQLSKVKCPVFLVINKSDLSNKDTIEILKQEIESKGTFFKSFVVSAGTGEGMAIFKQELLNVLPYGPAYFPCDQLMNQTERFVATEIIREQIFLQTKQEVPYCSAVTIDAFHELENKNSIEATIIVEKDSQKKIIIGKNGTMIKEIGTKARLNMESFFKKKVYLSLYVKTDATWRESKSKLKSLGYDTKPYLS